MKLQRQSTAMGSVPSFEREQQQRTLQSGRPQVRGGQPINRFESMVCIYAAWSYTAKPRQPGKGGQVMGSRRPQEIVVYWEVDLS